MAPSYDLPASAECHLFVYGLDVEIRPKWTSPELFIHQGVGLDRSKGPCDVFGPWVGRGVRLGSENSSGGAGSDVWKSGNLEIWEFGDLGIWRSGSLEIQKFGDLGTWKSRKLESKKAKKIKVLKIQIRSAQNVGKVSISRKKSSWPHLGPSDANFPGTEKIRKICKI